MKQSNNQNEIQRILLGLMDNDSSLNNFDKTKIIQDFFKDKDDDDDSVTHYTNIAV